MLPMKHTWKGASPGLDLRRSTQDLPKLAFVQSALNRSAISCECWSTQTKNCFWGYLYSLDFRGWPAVSCSFGGADVPSESRGTPLTWPLWETGPIQQSYNLQLWGTRLPKPPAYQPPKFLSLGLFVWKHRGTHGITDQVDGLPLQISTGHLIFLNTPKPICAQSTVQVCWRRSKRGPVHRFFQCLVLTVRFDGCRLDTSKPFCFATYFYLPSWEILKHFKFDLRKFPGANWTDCREQFTSMVNT